ncbi:MAG: flagellar basal body rod protein FlgC [Bdellovibrionales bacterium]|nr:flagellar basal body rod protein FlgC [Bdellovibrionales bacterium]
MFGKVYDIAAAAMSANRLRINTIASNIANANTTKTDEGGPYKRKDVALRATDIQGDEFASALDRASMKSVAVAAVVEDQSEPRMVYDPAHPDADPKTGMVAMPNINPVTEMVNMLSASNAYKAAAEVVNVSKQMTQVLERLAQRF